MGSYNKYDPRLESLVVETSTFFAPEIEAELATLEADPKTSNHFATRDAIARAVHREPEKATQINYERQHTGFRREITVTSADLERIYLQVGALEQR
jgi:hypothetical protein